MEYAKVAQLSKNKLALLPNEWVKN